MLYLIVVAILIIVVLSGIAAFLHWKLYKLKQLRKHSESSSAKNREKNLDSIVFIAQALLQNQVTPTEASIRISVLAESLTLGDADKEALSAFYQLASATSHIPILDDWQALSKQEKRDYDKERLKQEALFSDYVTKSAEFVVAEKDRLYATL